MLKITIETEGVVRVIELAIDEQKAFEFVTISPCEWIENAIRNRIRCAVNQIVNNTSDKNPKKISVTEKLAIVNEADIESAKEKQEKIDVERESNKK